MNDLGMQNLFSILKWDFTAYDGFTIKLPYLV